MYLHEIFADRRSASHSFEIKRYYRGTFSHRLFNVGGSEVSFTRDELVAGDWVFVEKKVEITRKQLISVLNNVPKDVGIEGLDRYHEAVADRLGL